MDGNPNMSEGSAWSGAWPLGNLISQIEGKRNTSIFGKSEEHQWDEPESNERRHSAHLATAPQASTSEDAVQVWCRIWCENRNNQRL